MQSATTWRVAVVGAGISGLAAAGKLHEACARSGTPLELVVFERRQGAGGVVATRTLAGYRVELGADSFITNKPWGVELCRRLGLHERLIPTDPQYRRSLVLTRGRPLPVPEGFQLLAPVRLRALLATPVLSWRGKLRAALEYFVPRGPALTDESLAHFVRRRFGREAFERLAQPLVGGIYTSDPEKLSLRGTMPRFLELEQEYGSVIRGLRRQAAGGGEGESRQASGARYGLFVTLPTGLSELFEALVAEVERAGTIRFGTEVSGVHPVQEGKGFVLELPAGARERFDAVILAVPAWQAHRLIAGFAPRAAAALSQIEYASTAIVVSGHRLSDVRHPLDAFGLVVPAVEKRRILAVSFTSRKFPNRAPAGCVQLRTFVGGAMQPELVDLSDAELTALVRDELSDILGVTWRPDFVLVTRWKQSMPQYHVGHLDKLAAIAEDLATWPRLALAGNAYRGVGLPDSIHSGEQAAERVLAACGC